MVVMADYIMQDRQSELWQLIHQLHLSYLETEDSPQKIEQRNKLENSIKDFLCIVPHQRKFWFHETADVLHRSASCKKDFSGYRAALAWNAISMYAGNLLSQPWRKEYRNIKLYCGFYKHEIEANLVGSEIMLEAMGYKHTGDSVMVLEGPICPDRVANVSRDSLFAFVECQIIKSIWEEVSQFKISWLEILEFRERHVCSPKQAVRALVYRWHERNYQSQNMHPHSHPQPVPTPNYSHQQPTYPVSPPMESYGRYQQVPQQCMYGANPYYNFSTYNPVSNPHCNVPIRYGTLPYSTPIAYHPSSKTGYHNNGFCCPVAQNGFVMPQNFSRAVPTAQLIELDYGMSENAQKSPKQVSNVSDNSLSLSKAREDGMGTFESWDYVFRNLESQGYDKDVGHRGDLLSPGTSDGHKRRSKPIKISEALQKVRIEDDKQRTDCDPYQSNKHNVVHSSSYDNLSSTSSTKRVSNAFSVKTKSLPREAKNYVEEKIPPQHTQASVTLDSKKNHRKSVSNKGNVEKTRSATLQKDPVLRDSKSRNKDEVDGSEPSKWQCNACTYLNMPSKDICEICGKSRSVLATALSPMAIGGSECPRCTLVNEKDVKICEACGASLTNSPTYI